MKGKYGRSRPYYSEYDGQIQVLKSGILALGDFTDAGASGYVDIPIKLPAGAIPLAWKAATDPGFTDIKRYSPADGTKILFTKYGTADRILDLTGCTVIVPEDGTTIAFTNTGNSTITDSADGFGDVSGGDIILVQGSTSNDGIYTVTTASDGSLTFTGEVFENAEVGVDGITFTILNAAETGGFVTGGIVATDGITISGSTSNDGDIAASDITAVKAGIITLGDDVLTEAEAGVAGITFTKAVTTTAVISVGVPGDTDRFSADTSQSVATAGNKGSFALAADACDGIADEQTIRVTITEDSDFTSYTEGTLSLKLFYLT